MLPVCSFEKAVIWIRGVGHDVPIGSNIQDAIDAANPGDTIRVVAGIFTENLEVTKSQTLEGGYDTGFTDRSPRDTTIKGASRVITITGSGIEVTVDGFEITGGSTVAGVDGAGIYADVDTGSKVVIHDNHIHSNDAGPRAADVLCIITLRRAPAE